MQTVETLAYVYIERDENLTSRHIGLISACRWAPRLIGDANYITSLQSATLVEAAICDYSFVIESVVKFHINIANI